MKYARFEDLPVWNAAVDLADKGFDFCADKSFDYQGDLRKQFGKAALSISNNIAEGFERRTTKELISFLFIARGSAGEVRSMLHVVARNKRYTHLEKQRIELFDLVNSIGKQLNGWIESLEKRTRESPVAAPV